MKLIVGLILVIVGLPVISVAESDDERITKLEEEVKKLQEAATEKLQDQDVKITTLEKNENVENNNENPNFNINSETSSKKTAKDRGFEEKSVFASSLIPNPSTSLAEDRKATIAEFTLGAQNVEIRKNQPKSWKINIPQEPFLCLLKMDVWHKGCGESTKTSVKINNLDAGYLNFSWPSLRFRNYVTFVFDGQGNDFQYATDYQGWIEANFFGNYKVFQKGMNEITLQTPLDQFMVKNVKLEVIYKLDPKDTIYDFRTKQTNKLPIQVSGAKSGF